MRISRRIVLGVALALMLTPTASFAQSANSKPSPTVTLSVAAGTVGQRVSVTGQNFSPGTAVSIQVCGNEAREGSTDCDVVAGQTVVTDDQGTFHGQVVVRFPPVPCPCVVWATSHSGASTTATAPLGIVAAQYTPPVLVAPSAPPSDVEVVQAVLEQHESWRGWFGLPVDARLTLTIRNPGQVTIARPVLSLSKGRGADTNGVVESPKIEPLRPGEERTIEVKVALGSLAYGTYTVNGSIGTSPSTFRVHTSVVPWGDGLLLIVLVGVAFRWLVHRRRQATLAALEVPVPIEETAEEAPMSGLRRDEIDLPVMATDDELVAWGASLVRLASDSSGLTDDDWLDLTEPEAIIVLPEEGCSGTVDVAFALPGFEYARTVAVCGDFNGWSPSAHQLHLRGALWTVVVPLPPERDHRYRFLVDGTDWVSDPFANRRVPNMYGSEDCVIHTRHLDDDSLAVSAVPPR